MLNEDLLEIKLLYHCLRLDLMDPCVFTQKCDAIIKEHEDVPYYVIGLSLLEAANIIDLPDDFLDIDLNINTLSVALRTVIGEYEKNRDDSLFIYRIPIIWNHWKYPEIMDGYHYFMEAVDPHSGALVNEVSIRDATEKYIKMLSNRLILHCGE